MPSASSSRAAATTASSASRRSRSRAASSLAQADEPFRPRLSRHAGQRHRQRPGRFRHSRRGDGGKACGKRRSLDAARQCSRENGPPGDDDSADREAREAIYAVLRAQTGHDFSGYKSRTFCAAFSAACRSITATPWPITPACCGSEPEEATAAVSRPADQCDELFSRPRSVRGAANTRSSPACSRDAAPSDVGAGLGARLRHRRGGLFASPSCCASIWTRCARRRA